MTTFHLRMHEARYGAAGSRHPSLGALISGGWNGSAALSSCELSTDGASLSPYTPLPFGLFDHCLVTLDSYGDFFLAGGWDGGPGVLDRAFIYTFSNWVEVTAMPTARKGKKSN